MDRGRRLGVGREPAWKGSPLFRVVLAQDAAYVGVVFGVAVRLAAEKAALEVVDARGGIRKNV